MYNLFKVLSKVLPRVLIVMGVLHEIKLCVQFEEQVYMLYVDTPVSDLDVKCHEAVSGWCVKNEIRLVVVGPEGPIAAGLCDHLNTQGQWFSPHKAVCRSAGRLVTTCVSVK